MGIETKKDQHTVKIHLDNEAAAKHFLKWLCGSGEQKYWQWMECREEEEDGPITAVDFDYWTFDDELDVVAECGRLDTPEDTPDRCPTCGMLPSSARGCPKCDEGDKEP
jgi:hypothetical protein